MPPSTSVSKRPTVTNVWQRDPNGATFDARGGGTTFDGFRWAHTLQDFFRIRRAPGLRTKSIFTRSQIIALGENYAHVVHSFEPHGPRALQPWPILQVPKPDDSDVHHLSADPGCDCTHDRTETIVLGTLEKNHYSTYSPLELEDTFFLKLDDAAKYRCFSRERLNQKVRLEGTFMAYLDDTQVYTRILNSKICLEATFFALLDDNTVYRRAGRPVSFDSLQESFLIRLDDTRAYTKNNSNFIQDELAESIMANLEEEAAIYERQRAEAKQQHVDDKTEPLPVTTPSGSTPLIVPPDTSSEGCTRPDTVLLEASDNVPPKSQGTSATEELPREAEKPISTLDNSSQAPNGAAEVPINSADPPEIGSSGLITSENIIGEASVEHERNSGSAVASTTTPDADVNIPSPSDACCADAPPDAANSFPIARLSNPIGAVSDQRQETTDTAGSNISNASSENIAPKTTDTEEVDVTGVKDSSGASNNTSAEVNVVLAATGHSNSDNGVYDLTASITANDNPPFNTPPLTMSSDLESDQDSLQTPADQDGDLTPRAQPRALVPWYTSNAVSDLHAQSLVDKLDCAAKIQGADLSNAIHAIHTNPQSPIGSMTPCMTTLDITDVRMVDQNSPVSHLSPTRTAGCSPDLEKPPSGEVLPLRNQNASEAQNLSSEEATANLAPAGEEIDNELSRLSASVLLAPENEQDKISVVTQVGAVPVAAAAPPLSTPSGSEEDLPSASLYVAAQENPKDETTSDACMLGAEGEKDITGTALDSPSVSDSANEPALLKDAQLQEVIADDDQTEATPANTAAEKSTTVTISEGPALDTTTADNSNLLETTPEPCRTENADIATENTSEAPFQVCQTDEQVDKPPGPDVTLDETLENAILKETPSDVTVQDLASEEPPMSKISDGLTLDASHQQPEGTTCVETLTADPPEYGPHYDPFGTALLPKLEEFIPKKYLPDILVVHDPDDTTGGRETDDVLTYRRVRPTVERETEKKEAHLYLRSRRLGEGHHSHVYLASMKLPEPLRAANSPNGHVAVAAKVAKPLRHSYEALELLNQEGRIYSQFPQHLMEHWCGYGLFPESGEPTPLGAVVPKFYGFYVPVGKKHKRASPILLIESCGQEVSRSMSLSERLHCISLYHRLHHSDFLQGSAYVRNMLVQPGPLTVPPEERSMDNPSFRLIDFGRGDIVDDQRVWDSDKWYELEHVYGELYYANVRRA